MRSYASASFIAHTLFWILLTYGWWRYDISSRAALTFLVLWLVGFWGLPYGFAFAEAVFVSYVAVLDMVLVLWVFKQDVTLW